MSPNFFTLLGVAFVISSAVAIYANGGRRNVLLDRIPFRRRRDSASNTPPRSLSPEKKGSLSTEFPDYTDTFPPSRREALKSILNAAIDVSDPEMKGSSLPIATSYLETDKELFTPCGFTTEEIKALGDFPDYAALSGVPLPQPYHEFDIKKALPRPYRPFRWNYHQTMSLTKMEPDWWLELENTYETRIKQRQDLFAQHGKKVLQALPGSELACKELMEMALQFMCARYPHYFRLDVEKMLFYNDILHTVTNLKETEPLRVLLDNVPEDFGIMLRDPETGYYFLRAAVVCSALGWNVATKIGKQLHQIHAKIPDYKEKMQFSMDRYFAKKPAEKPIQRGSWGLEVDQPLFMPPGDPHEKLRDVQSPDIDISRIHLRVDWQTLRRLPLSGSIIFNFKALFTPIEKFRDEPYVPALVLKVLKEGKESIMKYKGTWHTEHVVIPALEAWKKEQVEKGLMPEDWEERTLDESPYFPGWREKWMAEQGF